MLMTASSSLEFSKERDSVCLGDNFVEIERVRKSDIDLEIYGRMCKALNSISCCVFFLVQK
jgi:hypothetical protein